MRRDVLTRTLVLIGTMVLVVAAAALIPAGDRRDRPPPARGDQPQSGEELVVVLLVTRSCPAAQTEEFRASFREALSKVTQTARQNGLRSHVVGVMLGTNNGPNRRFISELAPFDEVIIGRGWLGTGAINYIWRDLPGPATVPHLLVLKRQVAIESENILISPDSLILRLSDAGDIVRWSRAGAPIEL